jgi:hypothetical protein
MMLLRAAAALQLAVAAANIPLTWMLRFGREHARLTPIVRQIHQVHHVFVGGLLIVFAAISMTFPRDLAAGDGLGRFISVVLAVFWGARLAVQRLYYDRDFLSRHRLGDVIFSAIFTVLFAVYAAAAAGALR